MNGGSEERPKKNPLSERSTMSGTQIVTAALFSSDPGSAFGSFLDDQCFVFFLGGGGWGVGGVL